MGSQENQYGSHKLMSASYQVHTNSALVVLHNIMLCTNVSLFAMSTTWHDFILHML